MPSGPISLERLEKKRVMLVLVLRYVHFSSSLSPAFCPIEWILH
jgi:hypothetical protein